MLPEKWKGVEGNQDIDRTQGRSQHSDPEQNWQSPQL